MEELNTSVAMEVRDAITKACAEEVTEDALDELASALGKSESSLADLGMLLDEWESFAKGLGKNAVLVHGYCLLLAGKPAEAEEVLKGQKKTDFGVYTLAHAALTQGRMTEALKAAEDGLDKFPDCLPLAYLTIEVRAKLGQVEEAEKLLHKLRKSQESSARYQYHEGLVLERTGEYQEAIQKYRQAVHADATQADAYFRLGYLLDLYGTDADEANDEAVQAYEACVRLSPVRTNAVINLGLLYEDRERFHDAIKCYEAVLRHHPNHLRARLYLDDAQAATLMFYDKEQEKKADRQSQVLKIPVSDFELSVRSRNCLQKMNIQCLGDLIMKTEQELLSYKNFGETSLSEIKEMLAQKGLRLGQGLENRSGEGVAGRNPLEATVSAEVLDKPIEELTLSVRSRRCMERLDVRSIRDLINKTEVELMSAKNFGMTSLNEIKRKLGELGLSLRS